MARKKRETMRQRQMRLRKQQRALTKTKSSALKSTRVEKVKVRDVTNKEQLKIKGRGPQRALPAGKKGGGLSTRLAGTGSRAVGKLASKIATPVAMAAEVKEMRDRSKRDRQRNLKLGKTSFGPTGQYRRAAEVREGVRKKRDRQGRRVSSRVENLPSDYKKTEAAAFAAEKKYQDSKPKRQNTGGGGSGSSDTSKPKTKPKSEYEQARSKLTIKSSKADRDAVRDKGMMAWANAHKGKQDAVGKKARAYLAEQERKKKLKNKATSNKGTSARNNAARASANIG